MKHTFIKHLHISRNIMNKGNLKGYTLRVTVSGKTVNRFRIYA